MGQDSFYFPSEVRRAEEFFALKNPKASTGFEPANAKLGTKGQHSTSRPPKPLKNRATHIHHWAFVDCSRDNFTFI
jgi:hypothetical protein